MKRKILWGLLFSLLLFLSLFGVFSFVMIGWKYEISRDAVIEMADAYRHHRWVATETNIHHDSPGPQPRVDQVPKEPEDQILPIRGVEGPVDTPDRNTYSEWPSWKGWAVGENTGVPYKWLGWNSLEEFNQGVHEGKYAGDINFAEGSSKSVGVDCAGFVSRCWRLPYDHTTKMLYDVSQPIKFDELKAGDILDHYGHHVMLFKAFLTPEKAVPSVTRIKVIEATSYDWKVNEWEYLLVDIRTTEEEWCWIKYAPSAVTLELVSPTLGLQRSTGPYVPRTRSAAVLYLSNIFSRHRNWVILFAVTSVTIGFTVVHLMAKRENK